MPVPATVEFLMDHDVVKRPSSALIAYLGCATCHFARQATINRTEIATCTGAEINTIGLGLKRLEAAGVLTTVSKPSQPGTPHTYAVAPTELGRKFQDTISLQPDCPLLTPASEDHPPTFHEDPQLMATTLWI